MPRHRRPLATAGVAAALLATAVALGGCQSSEDGSATAATGSSSPSAAASATPSATPSATSSSSASSGIAPATGPLLALTRASVHAPDGWKRMPDLVKFQRSAEDPTQIATTLSVSELPAAPRTLTSEARRAATGYPVKPKVLANVTGGGVEMYRVSGKINASQWVEKFGAIHNQNALTITFIFGPGVSPKDRKAAYEATLASVEWK